MVSLSPEVEPRDAAALREDAAAVEAAAADLAAQVAQLGTLAQRHLVLSADTDEGPVRVTLPTASVAEALRARLAILDLAAAAMRREAQATEAMGATGIRRELACLGRGLGQG